MEALHPLLIMTEDPGAAFRNFMYPTTVQTNAALALVRMCTVPGRSGAAIVSRPPGGPGGAQLDMDAIVGGMTGEAVRRLHNALAEDHARDINFLRAADSEVGWVARKAISDAIDGLEWPWEMSHGALDLYGPL